MPSVIVIGVVVKVSIDVPATSKTSRNASFPAIINPLSVITMNFQPTISVPDLLKNTFSIEVKQIINNMPLSDFKTLLSGTRDKMTTVRKKTATAI
jgi:hypothetical protein